MAYEIFHVGLWRIESKTIFKLISSQLGLCSFLHKMALGKAVCVSVCVCVCVCVVMGAVTREWRRKVETGEYQHNVKFKRTVWHLGKEPAEAVL